jgi:hypothetical protein
MTLNKQHVFAISFHVSFLFILTRRPSLVVLPTGGVVVAPSILASNHGKHNFADIMTTKQILVIT